MKKSKKLKVIFVVLLTVICISSTNIFAASVIVPTTGSAITKITNVANDIWATMALIIQILAIAAIILAGLRYMFASADGKADIKRQTMILVAGAVLVFAAVPIAQWVGKTANQIFTPAPAPIYDEPIGPTLPPSI